MSDLKTVGRSERRVDSVKLATGRGTFVDDIDVPRMLHARILHSPHAHARITRIDASQARAMPGVVCVLTHEDVPRVPYTTAGQGWPEPSPYDAVMLDHKVRFVGDRVAVVAADDLELAQRACEAIKVEYEVLPAILDPEKAMAEGAPVIHDQADASGIKDPARNLAAEIVAEVGSVERGFKEAERVFEATYRVPYVQQSSIEPHVTITWLDEDHRLVVRTSTQVPFHVRRIIAPLLGIPLRRIRRQAGDPDRGPLRDADPAHGAPHPARVHARGGADGGAHPPPADRHREERRPRRPADRPRDARPGEHRRLRHPRADGDERDRQPRALPVPLPEPALRGPRRLYEPGRGRRLSRVWLSPGLLRPREPRRRDRGRAGRRPPRVPDPQPRSGGRRPADRGGAGRGQGGIQADHPLLRPSPGHPTRSQGHGLDGKAKAVRRRQWLELRWL